jgi:hypothetical protein
MSTTSANTVLRSTGQARANYTQELDDARVLAFVGSVGDAYDNALAESFVDRIAC